MATMRAQVSLVFDDQSLFENMIEPYKAEKLLNGLILKCLSAYYYDTEVRNRVDGVTQDSFNSQAQGLCNEIRASLLMQDFIAGDLLNSMEAGEADVSDILSKVNDIAVKTGVVRTEESEFGEKTLRLGVAPQPVENTVNSGSLEDDVKTLMSVVSVLARASNNTEAIALLNGSKMLETKAEESDFSKTVIESQVAEVSQVEPNVDIISEEPKPVIAEVTTNTEPVAVDASDALAQLLGSL